jgi:hypothetical protein
MSLIVCIGTIMRTLKDTKRTAVGGYTMIKEAYMNDRVLVYHPESDCYMEVPSFKEWCDLVESEPYCENVTGVKCHEEEFEKRKKEGTL